MLLELHGSWRGGRLNCDRFVLVYKMLILLICLSYYHFFVFQNCFVFVWFYYNDLFVWKFRPSFDEAARGDWNGFIHRFKLWKKHAAQTRAVEILDSRPVNARNWISLGRNWNSFLRADWNELEGSAAVRRPEVARSDMGRCWHGPTSF